MSTRLAIPVMQDFQTALAAAQNQRQQQLAPAQALQQYAGIVSPIASGFPK